MICVWSIKNAKKLVYVGSTGSIPEAPKGSVMKEISYYDPEPVISAYGKSKAMASQLVLDAVKNQHLNACLVLPSGILGPGRQCNRTGNRWTAQTDERRSLPSESTEPLTCVM